MAERSIIFDLIGRDLASKAFKSVGDSADGLARKVDKLDKNLGSALKGMGAVAGVAATAATALAGIGFAAVKVGDEAANMNLAIGQAKLLFGKNFGAMDQWASTLSKRIGVTRIEGLRLAGGFANLARQTGWTERQTVGLAQQYVELIQRVQMLSGGQFDQAQAADAVASAFRGEYDSLQRVVPTISQAAIDQNALNIKKREGKRVTDDQARQLAVLDIVMRGTAAGAALLQSAEGKAAIEIANTKAQIREQWQQIELGLLPAISKLWQGVQGEVVPAMQQFANYVGSPEGQAQLQSFASSIMSTAKAFAIVAGAANTATQAIGGFLEKQLNAIASMPLIGSKPESIGVIDNSDTAREARRAGAGGVTGRRPSGGGGGIKIPVLPSGLKLGGGGGGGGASDIVNMMVRIGGAGAQGLAFGIRGKASVIQSAIQSVMDKAKETYQKQLDKLNELKGKRSDLANSVADGIKSAGGSAITGRGGGGLLGRLGQAARNAGSFYGALKKLRAMKVSPALLQQIAEAGPVDGLQAAREIIAAGSAHEFNKQQLMIDRYGAAAGKYVGDSVYGAAIKKQQGITDAAKRQIFGATIIDNRVNITIPKGYVGSAKDLAALIKDALKQSGNAGQRVKLT